MPGLVSVPRADPTNHLDWYRRQNHTDSSLMTRDGDVPLDLGPEAVGEPPLHFHIRTCLHHFPTPPRGLDAEQVSSSMWREKDESTEQATPGVGTRVSFVRQLRFIVSRFNILLKM